MNVILTRREIEEDRRRQDTANKLFFTLMLVVLPILIGSMIVLGILK